MQYIENYFETCLYLVLPRIPFECLAGSSGSAQRWEALPLLIASSKDFELQSNYWLAHLISCFVNVSVVLCIKFVISTFRASVQILRFNNPAIQSVVWYLMVKTLVSLIFIGSYWLLPSRDISVITAIIFVSVGPWICFSVWPPLLTFSYFIYNKHNTLHFFTHFLWDQISQAFRVLCHFSLYFVPWNIAFTHLVVCTRKAWRMVKAFVSILLPMSGGKICNL